VYAVPRENILEEAVFEMNERKKGIVITYCILIFNVLIGVFYTPFLLSKLGDSQYGIYSLASSLISLLSLLDLGFGQSMVRYISKARATNDHETEAKLNGLFLTLYAVIAVGALLVGLVLLSVYPRICKKTMSGEELALFRIVFMILLVNVAVSFPMSVFSAFITSYEHFSFYKGVNLAVSMIKYGSMVLLLELGYQVVAIALTAVVCSLATQTVYLLYSVKTLHIRFSFGDYDRALVKEIGWFSFYIFINILVDFLFNNTDKLILGAVRGTFAVTVYSIGVYFQTYYANLSTAISGVFMPQIVGLYENGRQMDRLSAIFIKVGRVQMIILVLILSGFITYGREFIVLWVGPEYLDAYLIGCLVMVPGLVPLTQNIGISILRAMNLHKYRSYMYLAIAVANVAVSIPLAVSYGGIGSAFGTCLANLAGQILFMNWFYAKRVGLDIKTYWKHLAKMILLAVFMILSFSLVKLALRADSWRGLVGNICLYGVCYLVLYWLFLANKYEKSLVGGILISIGRHLPLKNYIIFESKPCLADNTHAVYEELLRRGYQKKYKMLWLLDEDVDEKKLPKVRGVRYVRRSEVWKFGYYHYLARCIICCNEMIPSVKKAQVCFYIAHGTPLKQIKNYYTLPEGINWLITQSDEFNEVTAEQLRFPVSRAVGLGFPRNDVFAGEKRDVSLLFSDAKKKVIYWYPTFRQHRQLGGLTDCTGALPLIHSEEDAEELNAYAKQQNVIIIVKLHFAQDTSKVPQISLSNFKIIDDNFLQEKGINPYEFLASGDALLTDYSSVYYDFTLADRPIGVIWEDIEEYRTNPGFAVDLDYYMKGAEKIFDMSQLKDFIYNVSHGKDRLRKERSEIKRLVNQNAEGNAAQKVTDFIIEKANL
jgi:O-antigen/teichoic acid export membrane protein/CDP-glycerol glycerophosphotransferase (TagB/SpsB family)